MAQTTTTTPTKQATPGPAENKGSLTTQPAGPARGGLSVQAFIDHVFDEDRTRQVVASLGDAVSFDKFRASCATAIMNNPDLLQCQPAFVFREVARIASLGLVFDHHLGEAYLIAGYNRDSKKKDMPQCRVGYRGLMKLARNESNVMIYAHEVRQNDEFISELGSDKKLVHKLPDKFAPRGDVVGFYAVAKFRDDHDFDFEPMSQEEVNAIRDRTDGWKAFKDGKIKSTPWSTDPVEMGKKTVLRRLTKRLPLGPKTQAAIKIEDDAEGIIPSGPTTPTPPASRAIAGSGNKAGLDRFSGKTIVTDIKPEESGGQQDGSDAGGSDSEPSGGPQDQQQNASDGVYVEAEADDAPSQQSNPVEENQEALLALAPKMPKEAATEWEQGGKFIPGWKWISLTMPEVKDVKVRQALCDEHNLLLHAVAKKSPGYKQAIDRFLDAHGISLKNLPGESNG